MRRFCIAFVWLALSGFGFCSHAATIIVTNTADSGPGSLRQAITDANSASNPDTIAFNIPGSPPFKITLAFALPIIFNPVVIDGTTQPGYVNKPLIEIDGLLAGAGSDGLYFSSNPGSTVRGLAINHFDQSGVRFGLSSNLVERCFVGTDAGGTLARGNGYRGVWITFGAFNTIRSNVISGNLGAGVDLGTSGTNLVQGNFIGTDFTGTQPLGNRDVGLLVSGATSGQILANRIGGTNAGEGNIIAFNKAAGVFISRSVRNAILGNSIFANGGVGIDLSKTIGALDGPTRNDAGDSDGGGNLLQNFPVLGLPTYAGGNTTVTGLLNSAVSKAYRVELFANPNPSPKFVFSEGRNFLGFTNVNTDASGNAPFSITFAGIVTNLTATATDPDGNTSEFFLLDLPLPPATPLPGDIFVSIDGSRIQWRRADGTPVKQFATGVATASSPQGLALDRQGNLFATTVDGRSLAKFDGNGNLITNLTSGILFNTIGVRLDALGNPLLSLDNGDLMRLTPGGTPLNTYSFGSRIAFDLAADQQTLFYSPSISTARRYDLANERGLPDFATLSGPQLRDIQILSDGRVLIANNNLIYLLDATGATIRTFGQSSVPRGWGAIRVLPDGQSFWAAGDGAYLNRFDLNTGALLDRLYIEYQIDPLNFSGSQLSAPSALVIRGGFTAGNNTISLTTADNSDPVSAGGAETYTITAVNNSANPVTGVMVTNIYPSGTTFSLATTSLGSFATGGGQVVFNLGTLGVGASATMTVKVTTAAAGIITNSARLTGTGLSSASPDYLSVQTTLVVTGAASPTTVYTTNDAGPGSLRSAILAANNHLGLDAITFNIPGSGVRTIRPTTTLPFIVDPVTIDGYTQSGAQTNSLVQGFNGALMIELDGSLAGNSANGLTFLSGSGNSKVRGLVINRFSVTGISVQAGVGGSRIEGCFIGTDANGMTAAPNGSGGVGLNDLRGPFSPTDPTIVGGVTPDKRNVISGNNNFGIFVFGSLEELIQIKGNYIGTDKTGLGALGNVGAGVNESAPGCAIGGTEAGAGNIIAFNTLAGVTLGGRADEVPIRHNSIYSNEALGITGAGFAGPQLTGGAPGGATVSGFFQGDPASVYDLEFFSNVTPDPTGFGEGQTYVGTVSVTTDGSGKANFTAPVSPSLVGGQYITATAIGEDDNTSLFSHALLVGPATDLSIAQAVSANPLPAGSNVVFTLTISNAGPNTATGVSMNCQLPPYFTYVSGSPGVQSVSGGRITAGTTNLPAGTATNFTVTLKPKQVGFVVNTFSVVADQPDGSPGNNVSSAAYQIVNSAPQIFTVTNTNAFGAGSLYQAMSDASARSGGDRIEFNIPGSGVRTIQPSFLPTMTVPVTIDGYTQPGSKPNSLAVGSDAILLVELSSAGLDLEGGYSTVRGLVVNNASLGIYFGDPHNTIPGRSNVVEGCYIGVNAAGTLAKPNSSFGVAISGSTGDRIGGSTPAARNVISGNSYGGVGLLAEARTTLVQGNYIGTDASGVAPLGNRSVGVYGEEVARAGSVIGGAGAGQGNVIAFNGGPGVLIYTGGGHTISANSIFGNGGIGINLGGQGSVNEAPGTNDFGDADIGANDFLNAPVITQVTTNVTSTRVQGMLNTLPNRLHRLEFFSSPTNPAAFFLSQGKTYLGATNIMTDVSGNATFDITFPVASQFVSATATDPDGNTSPFFTFGYTPPPACFQAGDLLTGYYVGVVQWRRANGQPVRVLNLPDEESIGLAFSPAGQLHVAGFQGGQIHRFDACGTALSALVTGADLDPESILFDSAGNYYVGFQTDTQNVRKYGPAGNLLAQFSVAVEDAGADWIDLAADGHTLFYTSEGKLLKRFDLQTSTQLPDLVTNLIEAAGVRVLPDGGVLVANQQNVQRRDAAGNLVRSYTVPNIFYWTSVNLDPDGVSFWTEAGEPPYVFRFNIASGALISQIPVDVIHQASSLAVMGEVTAVGGGGSARPQLMIIRAGAEVVLSWPDTATNYFLEYAPNIGPSASWLSNATIPMIGGGQKTVHQGLTPTNRFFRLRKP